MGAAPMKFQQKNGRQKMKKTMGSAPFLQIHFFRAHDPGIPRELMQNFKNTPKCESGGIYYKIHKY